MGTLLLTFDTLAEGGISTSEGGASTLPWGSVYTNLAKGSGGDVTRGWAGGGWWVDVEQGVLEGGAGWWHGWGSRGSGCFAIRGLFSSRHNPCICEHVDLITLWAFFFYVSFFGTLNRKSNFSFYALQ